MWAFLISAFAYWAILFFLGYMGYKKTLPTATEYFLAGRALGPFVIGLAMLASVQSAWLMLGHQGLQYTVGLPYTLYFSHMFVMLFALLTFYRPLWHLSHKYGYVTVGEAVSDYFGSRIPRILIAILAIFYGIGYIAIQLVGAGLVFEKFAGWPFWAGAVAMSIVVGFYVIAGGWRSTAWTDCLQGILLVLGMFLLAGAVLWHVGGWEVMWDRALKELPAKYFEVPGGAVAWGLPFIFTLTLSTVCLLYTSPSPRD